MEVEVATVVNDAFKGEPIDGIIGLGFQALNQVTPDTVSPFMTRFLGALRTANERSPTLPVFTVDFNPKRNGSSPTVEIGKIDLAKANGSLSHAPVNYTSGRWQVEDVGFEVQGKMANVTGRMIIAPESELTNSFQILEDPAKSMYGQKSQPPTISKSRTQRM
ncbi:MAG: hypothetical protein Q9202_006972 [Teloschistes flavicans]